MNVSGILGELNLMSNKAFAATKKWVRQKAPIDDSLYSPSLPLQQRETVGWSMLGETAWIQPESRWQFAGRFEISLGGNCIELDGIAWRQKWVSHFRFWCVFRWHSADLINIPSSRKFFLWRRVLLYLSWSAQLRHSKVMEKLSLLFYQKSKRFRLNYSRDFHRNCKPLIVACLGCVLTNSFQDFRS